MSGERKPVSVGGAFLRLLVVAIGFGMLLAVVAVLLVIFPGMMKWTAPIVCPDGYPDPFVVRDTYSVQPGESTTTFTMYCMNDDGLVRDAGWFLPMLLITLGLAAVVVTLVAIGWLRRRFRGAGAVRIEGPPPRAYDTVSPPPPERAGLA